MKKRTNYVLIFVTLFMLFSLPVMLFNKNINILYNENKIDNKIIFYKTDIDKVINNIEEVKKELDINNKLIKEKEEILFKINDGMKKYDEINDSSLSKKFNKINKILENSKLNIISLTYVEDKFILELLIKDQNDLDKLKIYDYRINKINYEEDLFLINITIGVPNGE